MKIYFKFSKIIFLVSFSVNFLCKKCRVPSLYTYTHIENTDPISACGLVDTFGWGHTLGGAGEDRAYGASCRAWPPTLELSPLILGLMFDAAGAWQEVLQRSVAETTEAQDSSSLSTTRLGRAYARTGKALDWNQEVHNSTHNFNKSQSHSHPRNCPRSFLRAFQL